MSLAEDRAESAEDVGLRYATDAQPGLRRVRAGRGFRYLRPDGSPLGDRSHAAWIKGLAIPPAWRDVWISLDRRGHLQATGRDARGRKQYRYHPEWRSFRDRVKFERLHEVGAALPTVRHAAESALAEPSLSREKVLATVVWLLEATLVRVGNEEYARAN